MPQKTSSKQKFPPQGVKQLPPSKPAFQQTSQSPSLFPNALLQTTEHQCTNHWGLDSWGRGSANAMKESTIDSVLWLGRGGLGNHGLLTVTGITHSDGY